MIEKIHYISEIGCNAVFRKKKGVKNLTIRIKPDGEVNVTVPWYVSLNEAEIFIKKKKKWINETRERSLQNQKNNVFDYGLIMNTKFHKISVHKTTKTRPAYLIDYHKALIFIPEKNDIFSDDMQSFIKYAIHEVLRSEAKEYLPGRVQQLAKEYGFSYKTVKVKNMKTRWGSCSSQNNINLNIQLMRFPQKYIDYIIMHELLHTKIKNHGSGFWKELNLICPEAKQLARTIRRANPMDMVMVE